MTGEPEPDRLDSILSDVDLVLLPAGDQAVCWAAAYAAWSRGVPVLAARSAEPARAVRQGENGLTFPLNDPDELAALIRRVSFEPRLLSRLRVGASRGYGVDESRAALGLAGRRRQIRLEHDRWRHAAVFTDIYARDIWRLGGESASGPGSRRDQTQVLRAELPSLLARLRIRRLLDVGCGDFNWMREMELPVDLYIGVDVVADVVKTNQERYPRPGRRFQVGDLLRDPLPPADLVLCRDVLIHIPNEELPVALNAIIATGARYLLAGTFIEREETIPIELGDWRPLNLERPPLCLPPPMKTILETPDVPGFEDKRLGLWDLGRLRKRC
jgi:SAM-dependent methyltransferase